MGRKTRGRRYDAQKNSYVVASVRDDRSKARKVQTARQLSLFANNNGAVSNELVKKNLVTYSGESKVEVNKERVRREVAQIQREIEEARFEGDDQIKEQYEREAEQLNLTPRQARNLNKREYSIRAQALLTALEVGKVKINSYQKGILNNLANGKYDDAVFGKQKEDGRRRYEAGTFRAQLRSRRTRSNDPSVQARARENLQYLNEQRAGGRASTQQFGSFLSAVNQNRQQRQSIEPPPLPDNFRDIEF